MIPWGPKLQFIGEKSINPLILGIFAADEIERIIIGNNETNVYIHRHGKILTTKVSSFDGDLFFRFHHVQKPLDVSAKPLSDENDKESCKIQWQYDEKRSSY